MIDDDNSDLLAAASEIQRNRLYFVAFKKNYKPKCSANTHYFSIDDDFVYENFYNDFGPLNICMLYRYCQMLNTKLIAKCHANKKIIHYTSINPAKRLNSAYLIGSYSIIYLNKTPEEAHRQLVAGDTPAYTRFCDASYGTSNYKISLLDCLNAVYKALNTGFFNFNDFDAEEYEYFERVENGDFNWIVPQKFIAFCGPHQKSKTLPNGYPCHSPETYFEYFRENNVTTVIRLNAKVYQASSFENAGFDHKDLFFIDGSTPSDLILKKFLTICEANKGAIAVHCKAGLGRTGSLIGAYIMKHYNFTALEAIAWLRLCRPGSVIGHQQQWMEDKQAWLWSEGERMRKRMGTDIPHQKFGIYSLALKSRLAQSAENTDAGLLTRVTGISQRVDTMHLHDGEELYYQKQLQQQQQNSLNNNNDNHNLSKLRKKDDTIVVPVNIELEEESDLEQQNIKSLTNKRETVCNSNNIVTNKPATMPLRRRAQQLITTQSINQRKLNDVAQRATISSTVRMAQAAYEKRNQVPTQGDKLNQIKALRLQQHTSRALNNNAANGVIVNIDTNGPLRYTRARSQPFRNNTTIVNVSTTDSVYNAQNSEGIGRIAYEHNNVMKLDSEMDATRATTVATTTENLTNNNNVYNGNNYNKNYNNNKNNSNNTNINNNIINNNNNNTVCQSSKRNLTESTSLTTTTAAAAATTTTTNAITTRARSLALYSKRKAEILEPKHLDITKTATSSHNNNKSQNNNNNSSSNNNNNNIVKKTYKTTSITTTSTRNSTCNYRGLNQQTENYDKQVPLSDRTDALRCASKIPIIESAATIPPIRSSARLQHHMLLRGRSRIRHHRRNCAAAAIVATPCTSVAVRYISDLSNIPRTAVITNKNENNQNTWATTAITARSASATLDVNSNPAAYKDRLSPQLTGRRAASDNNNYINYNSKINSSRNNNSQSNNSITDMTYSNCINNNNDNNNTELYNDDSLSDNSYSISSTSSSHVRTVTRRRFNANLFSTDTNSLSRYAANCGGGRGSLDSAATQLYANVSQPALIKTLSNESNNNNNNQYENPSSSAVGHSGSSNATASAIKRNKRSLSSTRIEIDKCYEYNTKLLRKTTPPMINYENSKLNKQQNKNINNNNNQQNKCNKNICDNLSKSTECAIKSTKSASTRFKRTECSTSIMPNHVHTTRSSVYLCQAKQNTIERTKQSQTLCIKLTKS